MKMALAYCSQTQVVVCDSNYDINKIGFVDRHVVSACTPVRVRVSDSPVLFTNQVTDVHETWVLRSCHWRKPQLHVFNFLQSVTATWRTRELTRRE